MIQGFRTFWPPLQMTLALLSDDKGPSAICQQKFRTALDSVNAQVLIWTQFLQVMGVNFYRLFLSGELLERKYLFTLL